MFSFRCVNLYAYLRDDVSNGMVLFIYFFFFYSFLTIPQNLIRVPWIPTICVILGARQVGIAYKACTNLFDKCDKLTNPRSI